MTSSEQRRVCYPSAGGAADRLLTIARIYHGPDIGRFPRARQVLDRFANAERIEVPSQQAFRACLEAKATFGTGLATSRKCSSSARRSAPQRAVQRFDRAADGNWLRWRTRLLLRPRRKRCAIRIAMFANARKPGPPRSASPGKASTRSRTNATASTGPMTS